MAIRFRLQEDGAQIDHEPVEGVEFELCVAMLKPEINRFDGHAHRRPRAERSEVDPGKFEVVVSSVSFGGHQDVVGAVVCAQGIRRGVDVLHGLDDPSKEQAEEQAEQDPAEDACG